jgi:large subunit ribosomal protein L4e
MWMGAFAPNTRGGRRAFAPRAGKVWAQKINDQERRKAIRSAIAATMVKEFVASRGHKVPQSFPFIIDDSFEALKTSQAVEDALMRLQLGDELARASVTHTRGGRAARRGRGTVRAIGPLLVVSKDAPVAKAARNVPGVDVVVVDRLNARLLAPGREPARLTLFTAAAVQKMEKESLFI